jgi:hypothetical protein
VTRLARERGNQQFLIAIPEQNLTHTAQLTGAVRNCPALLAGLLRCGRCGRPETCTCPRMARGLTFWKLAGQEILNTKSERSLRDIIRFFSSCGSFLPEQSQLLPL